MAKDNFMMPRRTARCAKQDSKFPAIKIRQSAYALLNEMAIESGKSMTEIATRAVQYAYKHLEYVDPDEEVTDESWQ